LFVSRTFVDFEIALSKPKLDRGETVATDIIMPVTIAAFVNLTLISDSKFQNFAHGNPKVIFGSMLMRN
jgi:hypothetical protein